MSHEAEIRPDTKTDFAAGLPAPFLTSERAGWSGLSLSTYRLTTGGEDGWRTVGDAVLGIGIDPSPFRLDWKTEGDTPRDVVMERGAFNIAAPGQPHWPQWQENGTLALLEIPTSALERAAGGDAVLPGIVDARNPTVRQLIDQLIVLLRHPHPDPLRASAIGYGLAGELARSYSSAGPRLRGTRRGLGPAKLAQALEFLHDNLSADIDLQSLADELGYGTFYAAHSFRLATGVGPHEYLIRARVDAASALLRSTKRPVAEIADSVGFVDASHFSRTFRLRRGQTPTSFRRRLS